jgi:two-component system sensor histidine kinase ChvG
MAIEQRLRSLPSLLRPGSEGALVGQLRLLRVRAVFLVTAVVFLPLLTALIATGFETQLEELLRLTLAVLPVAMLVAWWLGWRLVRPIEHLRRQIVERLRDPGRVVAGELEVRSRDEFSDLVATFNDLLTRLAERDAANEAFVADLAHEFKNPVAAIRACAESLGSGDGVDAARAKRLAGVLSASSSQLDALVTQLLDLARAEAGMVGEQREEVDLVALAGGVVDSARADERNAGVHFRFEASGDGRIAGAVPGRLESALCNLVDNAVSFNRPGGSVAVYVHSEASWVRVEVRDAGPGIGADDLPRVFDRFFTTRSGNRGTGLGLAMVRAITEAHGGRVEVASEPGVETRLTMLLPVDADQSPSLSRLAR